MEIRRTSILRALISVLALMLALATMLFPAPASAAFSPAGSNGSCAWVKQHVADYKGHKTATCLDIGPRAVTVPATGTAGPKAGTAQATTTPTTSCVTNRFEICVANPMTFNTINIDTGMVTGGAAGTIFQDYALDPRDAVVNVSMRLHLDTVWGDAPDYYTGLSGSCSSTCTAQPYFEAANLAQGADIWGGATIEDTVTPNSGAVDFPTVVFELNITSTHLGATIRRGTWPSPQIRCDGLDGVGNTAGCVNPSFWPTITSMKSLPNIAANIMRIQNTGPSHYGRQNSDGTGNPLHRLLVANNRGTACPPPTPSPYPDWECDEYPFDKSREGAGMPGIDPADWGSTWVPKEEQRSQGGMLGPAFFVTERVLGGDAFWVDVSGAAPPPPPPAATVSLVSGLSSGATFTTAGATTLTASASASDDLRFHFQQNGVDKLVSPAIAVTPGTTNYSWSFDPATLPNGSYEAFAQSSSAGAVSRSEVVTVIVAIPPKVTIDSGLANGGTYGASPVAVTGTATPAADYFYFHFQQGGIDKLVSPPVWGNPGTPHHTWQFDPASLPSGTYQVFAAATLGGVLGVSPTITITVNKYATSDSSWSLYNPDTNAMSLFGIGSDGALGVTRSPDGGASWSDWVEANAYWKLQGRPTAVYDTAAKMTMLFARGQADSAMGISTSTDNGVSWTNWAQVSPYWSNFKGDPSALYNPDTKVVTVFARGGDGKIGYLQSGNAGLSWSNWAEVNAYWNNFSGDPHVIYNPNTRVMTVFARGGDGKIGYTQSTNDGASWSNWAEVNAYWNNFSGDPYPVYNASTKTISLVARGGDLRMGFTQSTNDGASWSNWAEMNAYWNNFSGDPTGTYDPATAETTVFARGSGGHIGYTQSINSVSGWTNWAEVNAYWTFTGP